MSTMPATISPVVVSTTQLVVAGLDAPPAGPLAGHLIGPPAGHLAGRSINQLSRLAHHWQSRFLLQLVIAFVGFPVTSAG